MKELFRKLILIVVTVSMLSVGAIAQEIATPDGRRFLKRFLLRLQGEN